MSYENAAATEMLATHCACCGRPLLDAESVERGVGPDCARRHGLGKASRPADWDAFRRILGAEAVDLEAIPAASPEELPRAIANRLVYAVALEQDGDRVKRATAALAALGFDRLAARIADRLGSVYVEAEGDELVVKTPFSERWNELARGARLGRFDWDRKVRVVPVARRRDLWKALRAAFPGFLVVGENGIAVA